MPLGISASRRRARVPRRLLAHSFAEAATIAIRLATMESRMRRLAREIRWTNSRVNALRTRIVPRLEAETRAVAQALDQRERDDRHRFKRVKAKRRATAEAALSDIGDGFD